MKKLMIIFILIFIPFCVFSQQVKRKYPLPLAKYNDNVKMPLSAKEHAQIIEVYGESADRLVFNNPHRLKSIKHILRNRVVIKLITDENKKKPCTKLSEIIISEGSVSDSEILKTFDPNNFNPLKYNFNFYSRAGGLYHVDNTDYYIIIKSQYQ